MATALGETTGNDANVVEDPISSPSMTAVVGRALRQEDLEHHVMVCGDVGPAPALRLRRIAEESLTFRRQVVYLSNNDRCFGFKDAFPGIARLSARVHATPLTPQDGRHIATIAAEKRTSMAIDLGGFDPVEVSTFLEGFIGEAVTFQRFNADLFFECMDDQLGRKRNHDTRPVAAFKTLLLRGPATVGGTGTRVCVSATSPDEVPIETDRNTMTLIACRTSKPANVRALSKAAGDPALDQFVGVAPWGVRSMHQDHQWLYPFHAGLMHMPFYSPMTPLVSGAGSFDDFDVETTSDEQVLLDRLLELRAEAAGQKAAEAPTARGTSSKNTPVATATKPSSELAGLRGKVKATGVSYYVETAAIIAGVHSIATTGSLPRRDRAADHEAMLAKIHCPHVRAAAAWMGRLTKNPAPRQAYGSAALLGTAYAVARAEDASGADAFFAEIAALRAPTDLAEAIARLADAKIGDERRYHAIMASIRAKRLAPANDDAAIGHAA